MFVPVSNASRVSVFVPVSNASRVSMLVPVSNASRVSVFVPVSNASRVSVFVPESNANGVSLLFSLSDWLFVTPCNNCHSLHFMPDVSVLFFFFFLFTCILTCGGVSTGKVHHYTAWPMVVHTLLEITMLI